MSIQHWTNDNGTLYVSCDVLAVGDYGGAGDVGEANVRALQRDYPDSVVETGNFGGRTLWLPSTDETEEIVRALNDDHSLYDEEELSRVETEWEEEAWKNWLCDDLLRTLEEGLRDWADTLDNGVGGLLWECYRHAMDTTNTYPVYEYSGCVVDVDRIQEAFADALMSQLADQDREAGADDHVPSR